MQMAYMRESDWWLCRLRRIRTYMYLPPECAERAEHLLFSNFTAHNIT